GNHWTVKAWIDDYIDKYTGKERSIINLKQARDWYLKFSSNEKKLLTSITKGDADEFRRWLSTQLGDNTVRVHCRRVKQFFRAAVRKRLIDDNPFGDMKGCYVKENRQRDYFVSRDDSLKILDYCPGA